MIRMARQEVSCTLSRPATLSAWTPSEVAAAVRAVEQALSKGFHLVGDLSYELGYALSTIALDLELLSTGYPLLWFGVFECPKAVSRAQLHPSRKAHAGALRHEWDHALQDASEALQVLTRMLTLAVGVAEDQEELPAPSASSGSSHSFRAQSCRRMRGVVRCSNVRLLEVELRRDAYVPRPDRCTVVLE
jgi:hypothetical protein